MNVVVRGCAVVVVDEVLEQHAADALHHAAEDLAFDDHGVDHAAAVLRHDVALHLGDPRVGVDLDDADVGRVRPRGELRRSEADRRLESRCDLAREVVRVERAPAWRRRASSPTSTASRAPTPCCRRSRGLRAQLPSCARRSSAPSRAPRPWPRAPRLQPRPRCGSRRCRDRRASPASRPARW